MLGSKSNFFKKDKRELLHCWGLVYNLLEAKGYSKEQILVYEKAYIYFCNNPNVFDGATLVKDLCDIPDLDLDAMLHDYHYVVFNAGANLITKYKADWLYAKENERKGKGQFVAYSKFILLTTFGSVFIFYALYARGRITEKQIGLLLSNYKLLIR